jgi:hypothetical protein
MDSDQDLILPGNRFLHFPELKNIRSSIVGAHNRFHQNSFFACDKKKAPRGILCDEVLSFHSLP